VKCRTVVLDGEAKKPEGLGGIHHGKLAMHWIRSKTTNESRFLSPHPIRD
jgi:hypothetical protein